MNSEREETMMADRSALSLIGLLLAAVTLLVTITAAVAVSDYRGETRAIAALPAPPMTPPMAPMMAAGAAVK